MVIREMIAEDIPKLAQLYKQFWNEESLVEIMHEQFIKFQKNNSHILISAIENNKLIGSVMGVICEELYGDCKAFLVLENMIVIVSPLSRQRFIILNEPSISIYGMCRFNISPSPTYFRYE